jgi:cell division protein FtsB
MTKAKAAWSKINSSDEIKTLGIMIALLGIVIQLLLTITSAPAQEVKDLKKDYAVECITTAKERAENRKDIAVLQSQYDNLEKGQDEIKQMIRELKR